jgi:endonuclease/exonuclease/phosphatase family metal-dependent hydrolase
MKLNILHLNVERNKHTENVLELIKNKNPDIVCLEEAMYKDVLNISSTMGFELAFSPRVIIKQGNGDTDKEGSAILSRYPIKDVKENRYDSNTKKELFVYTEDKIISKNGKRPEGRFLLRSNLLTCSVEYSKDKMVTIATTHFPVVDHSTPGLPDHDFDDIKDISEIENMDSYLYKLITFIKSLKAPIIFTADLNNTRGEYIYDTIAHELIDIVPSSVISTIDPKLHIKGNELKLCVDTIMISPDISSNNFEVIEGVSDHKTLLASINI